MTSSTASPNLCPDARTATASRPGDSPTRRRRPGPGPCRHVDLPEIARKKPGRTYRGRLIFARPRIGFSSVAKRDAARPDAMGTLKCPTKQFSERKLATSSEAAGCPCENPIACSAALEAVRCARCAASWPRGMNSSWRSNSTATVLSTHFICILVASRRGNLSGPRSGESPNSGCRGGVAHSSGW